MRTPDYQSQNYRLWILRKERRRGVQTLHVKVRDRYSRLRYRAERSVFAFGVKQIERYLARRPHIGFDHPKNRARQLIYLPRSLRLWAQYMPGGFATHPVHNPKEARLHTGEKIDYLTRNLFQHSIDSIGLRSRAYAMSWYAITRLARVSNRPVRWLSVAAGTGQPTFDAAVQLGQQAEITLCDIDGPVLEFARALAAKYGLADSVTTECIDITRPGIFAKLLDRKRPDVVDMMGLMEYLDDDTVARLVNEFRHTAASGSTLIFTNMRPTHPQLQTHKRGLGWPGVIVRSIDAALTLIDSGGASPANVEVLLPDDKVYAVYCINQP